MLTEEEENFYTFWEENRESYSTTKSKLLRGLPYATLFGLPIILFIAVVYIFFPDWYLKISKTSPESYLVVFIAIIIFIIIYAFIRMHFKWEMNEQAYKEMKQIKKKEQAAKS
jgi:phosphotransferase system  glucose/maltose/N-acetylglucosamine-specific IIC component